MNIDIKQRIEECMKRGIEINLLRDCLKHIEGLTTDPNYEGGVQYWIGRHNRMASLATKLEAQLREREAEIELLKIPLAKVVEQVHAKYEQRLQAVERESAALRLASEELIACVRHGDQEDIGEAMAKVEAILQPAQKEQ